MAIDLGNISPQPKPAATAGRKQSKLTELLSRDIQFSTGLSDKKKERFYSGLAILFSSGVDIRTVLDLIEDEQTGKADRALFGRIRKHIMQGGTFSSAMQETGKFSTYEYYSIKIGEESGRLAEVLQDLAGYFSKRIEQRRKLVSGLSYPVLVFFTAFGAIWFMLRFVVPMFEDVFARFGGELPALTQFVIQLSEGMSGSLHYIGAAVLLLVLVALTQRNATWYRKLSATILMNLPVLGPLVRYVYLARFCHSMHLLVGANTPLVEALGLVEKMIRFYPMEKALHSIREQVLHGTSLEAALSGYAVFPKRLVSLIKVAEEVNQLDKVFGKLAGQYGQEVEHRSGVLSAVLEPLLIIFIGVFVALILVAMYLPLFDLSTSIG